MKDGRWELRCRNGDDYPSWHDDDESVLREMAGWARRFAGHKSDADVGEVRQTGVARQRTLCLPRAGFMGTTRRPPQSQARPDNRAGHTRVSDLDPRAPEPDLATRPRRHCRTDGIFCAIAAHSRSALPLVRRPDLQSRGKHQQGHRKVVAVRLNFHL